jgi:hypothetical protein
MAAGAGEGGIDEAADTGTGSGPSARRSTNAATSSNSQYAFCTIAAAASVDARADTAGGTDTIKSMPAPCVYACAPPRGNR